MHIVKVQFFQMTPQQHSIELNNNCSVAILCQIYIMIYDETMLQIIMYFQCKKKKNIVIIKYCENCSRRSTHTQ